MIGLCSVLLATILCGTISASKLERALIISIHVLSQSPKNLSESIM